MRALPAVAGWLACVLVVVGARGVAVAETARIEASGAASAEGEDARARAIDEAFADAVEQALVGVLRPEVRARHRDAIRRKVLRRARLFVKAYKVRDESTRDGTTTVRIAAQVDLDALRERFEELEIEVIVDGGDGGDGDDGEVSGRTRPKIALLLVVSGLGDEAQATFGKRAGGAGEVAEAVRAELVARGFDVVSAIGQPVPVSRAPGEGLPLDDAAAATLSAAVGAGGAVVMGVRVARDGAIRGTSLLGAVSEVAVRVIDASSADSNGEGAAAEVAMTRLSEAGAGPEAGAAAEAAARAGGVAAIAAIADRAADYWPAPVRADGAVTVQIEGYRTWLTVEAILRTLSGTRGVTQVWPQALGRRRVVLAVVTGLAPQRVAAVIRRADLPSGRARAKPAGPGAVIVRISGETRPGAD